MCIYLPGTLKPYNMVRLRMYVYLRISVETLRIIKTCHILTTLRIIKTCHILTTRQTSLSHLAH